ncbi:MAG: hypothetical protein H7836_05525 [Magnetococcus sp. YQC-3]
MALPAQAEETVACLGHAPLAAAESLYKKHRAFTRQEPKKLQNIVTTGFLDSLSFEYRCRMGGELCAIEADPWSGAQDGDIKPPISFRLRAANKHTASVEMHYALVIDKARQEMRTATIQLERNNAQECWQVADLLAPGGSSTRQAIEAFRKEFGNPPPQTRQ